MRGEYFYGGVIGIICGVLGGSLGMSSLSTAVWLVVLSVVCALVAIRFQSSTVSVPLLMSIVLLGIGVLFLRIEQLPSLQSAYYDQYVESEVVIQGVVRREPEHRDRTTHVYIDTGTVTVLAFTDRYSDIRYGDVVVATGTLQVPHAFTTEFDRTFDYAGYLAARDTGYTLRYATVQRIGRGAGNPVVESLLSIKQTFLHTIRLLLPEPHVGLAAGLLLGVKEALGEQLEEQFRAVGLTHIVVLSGYNVMLVVAFFMYVLAFVLPYRWRLMVGMVGIIGFALMVGLSATVVRASVMAGLLLLVQVVGGTHNIVRALCVAGVIMLIINPYLLLHDVGFQLSFLATAALIVGVDIINRWFGWMPGTFGLREFAVATVTTQVFVTPLLLYHIGEVSLVAVVVNVLVLPIVPAAMLLTFIAGIVGLVSVTVGMYIAFAAYAALSYIILVTELFASLPIATVTVPTFHWSLLIFVYGGVGYGIYRWYTSGRASSSVVQQDVTYADWEIVDETEVADERSSSATPPVFFR